jgi:hypothetical protein
VPFSYSNAFDGFQIIDNTVHCMIVQRMLYSTVQIFSRRDFTVERNQRGLWKMANGMMLLVE